MTGVGAEGDPGVVLLSRWVRLLVWDKMRQNRPDQTSGQEDRFDMKRDAWVDGDLETGSASGMVHNALS